MNTKLIGIPALASLIAFFVVLPVPEAPQPANWPTIDDNTFALRGVRVFDGREMHESLDVLVEAGVITAVSPKLPVPEGMPELGNGAIPVFSGPSLQAPPTPVPLTLDGSWQEHTIELSDVPGLDLARLRAVGLTAGPAPGAARLEIDSVVLR